VEGRRGGSQGLAPGCPLAAWRLETAPATVEVAIGGSQKRENLAMGRLVLLAVALESLVSEELSLGQLTDIVAKSLEENSAVADALIQRAHVFIQRPYVFVQRPHPRVECAHPRVERGQSPGDRGKAATHFLAERPVFHARTLTILELGAARRIPPWTPARALHLASSHPLVAVKGQIWL
jgi:hypothetical protein